MQNPASPTDQRVSERLDNPPPSPGGRKGSLLDAANPGLGEDASNPQIMAMHGMQLTERGLQMLAIGLPVLQPQIAQLLTELRQAVPQAMSGNSMGPMGQGAMPGPPGMPPSLPPPGGPPVAPSPPMGQ